MIEKRVIPASASPLPSAREHTLASVLPSMASQRKNFAWPAISLRSEGPSYRGRPIELYGRGSVQLRLPTVCCSLRHPPHWGRLGRDLSGSGKSVSPSLPI